MKNNKLKRNNGITLIALVITIIVMLILVAVTISMAVNGGLFEYAQYAGTQTNGTTANEQLLASGQINIDGTVYDINEYVNSGKEEVAPNPTETFSAIYETNTTISDGGRTAVIPKGFAVGTSNGINTIAGGLVITDKVNEKGQSIGNEFVWIPVTADIGTEYDYDKNGKDSGYGEPKELTSNYSSSSAKYDSQTTLNYLYGENYYTYSEDFKYAEEYAQMVEKVNEHNGFYIGRYETTIDSDGKIGSKCNTPVLRAGTTLFSKEGTNYPYRWYGLYQAGKNADVTGNGTDVQTAMIYGVLYDEAMQFIRDQNTAGKTSYNVDKETAAWHTGSNVVNSGQLNPGISGDVALNIWDLESNALELTQEAGSSGGRVSRGR